jgi:hypothetical protein
MNRRYILKIRLFHEIQHEFLISTVDCKLNNVICNFHLVLNGAAGAIQGKSREISRL